MRRGDSSCCRPHRIGSHARYPAFITSSRKSEPNWGARSGRPIKPQFPGDCVQPHICGKKVDAVTGGGREQVNIDPANSAPVKPMPVHKRHDFGMRAWPTPCQEAIPTEES